MKRYLSKFEFTESFIEHSILDCLSHRTGKVIRWNRKDTSYFLAEYFIKAGFAEERKTLYEVSKFIYEDVDRNFSFYTSKLVPFIAQEMLKEIKERDITLKEIAYQQRIDKSSGKIRDIGITSIKQQVYDYICVNALKPLFDAKIGYYQCSSIKGRGQKHAKKAIEKCIRQKHRRARYVIKSDVKKCYKSIRHKILFKFLERDLKNDDVLYLVEFLVSTYANDGIGLCIGTYLSQYLANYFLSYAYHFSTERAYVVRKQRRSTYKKEIRPFTRVVFYMDDMVFIGAGKKYMKKAFKLVINYLKEELWLELKHDNYQVIDLYREKAFVDVVGFRFYVDRTTIRKRIYKRICADVKKIEKHAGNTDVKICRSFMSRHGFVKNSNSVKYRRKSKYDNIFKIAKKVISYETKNNLHRKSA